MNKHVYCINMHTNMYTNTILYQLDYLPYVLHTITNSILIPTLPQSNANTLAFININTLCKKAVAVKEIKV